MNNVILMGRLVRDPELRYTQTNTVARFTVAVDKDLSKDKKAEYQAKNMPTADYINCQAWGKLAEFSHKYTGKGLRVLIVGSIVTGSYEKDGRRVYTTDINCQKITPIDWPSQNNDIFEADEDITFNASNDDKLPF